MKLKKGLVIQKLGEKYVIFDNETSTLHEINDVGFFIMERLKKDINKRAIIEKLVSEYEVDEKTASKDLKEFIQALAKMDLIVNSK